MRVVSRARKRCADVIGYGESSCPFRAPPGGSCKWVGERCTEKLQDRQEWLSGEEEFLASNMNKQLAEFEAASDSIGAAVTLSGACNRGMQHRRMLPSERLMQCNIAT